LIDWMTGRSAGFSPLTIRPVYTPAWHRHLTAYQIGCEVGQSVVLVLRPAILNRHILALDVAGFTNALPECGQKACTIGRRPRAAEESYHRHRRLLRARCERPCGGRAAERG
jgi:hypothetical protein